MPSAPTTQNATLRAFVQKPLTAWLKKTIQGIFNDPSSTETFDIVLEAVVGAIKDTIGNQPGGEAALRQFALEILDKMSE